MIVGAGMFEVVVVWAECVRVGIDEIAKYIGFGLLVLGV